MAFAILGHYLLGGLRNIHSVLEGSVTSLARTPPLSLVDTFEHFAIVPIEIDFGANFHFLNGIEIDGLIPVIINVTPASSLPLSAYAIHDENALHCSSKAFALEHLHEFLFCCKGNKNDV